MNRPKHLFATIALALAVSASAQDFYPREKLERVQGTFRSTAPEAWYGGYGTREFRFADGEWQLIFTHALDRDMTRRTFQFRTGGAFTVGEASNQVVGAYRTVFDEDWKLVTLLTDDAAIIAAMGLAQCGLTYNLEFDISEAGCGSWAPVAECSEDHDLFAMDESGLYFGVRPADNDLCSPDKTPTALLPAVERY